MNRVTALILALLTSLAVAPAAHANAFKDIFGAYRKSGKVDGCAYSAKQLTDAKQQVPNDIAQYAPDFPNALDNAIQQRAAGTCAKAPGAGSPAAGSPTASSSSGPTATTGEPPGATSGPTLPPAAGQTPQPTPTPAPAPSVTDHAVLAASKTKTSDAGVPAPLVALAIVGGLMLLGALAYALARWWAWEPRWLVRSRHAGAEAGWRASGAWAEFMDWVRLGR